MLKAIFGGKDESSNKPKNPISPEKIKTALSALREAKKKRG